MRALRRRWKLAVMVSVPVTVSAAFFFSPLVALAAGSCLGIGLVLLLESLDRTVKTADDVRDKLGLALLGVLPRFSEGGIGHGESDRYLITRLPDADPALAAYRVLRTRLDAALDNVRHRVVMVTSSIPGEGKSTVSGNLAAILGETGAKTLLVGCDLRRPTLGEMFGQARAPGLTELLVNGDQSALRTLADPPIDFMPGGSIPASPAELLASKGMQDFLEFARGRYDYVIIDAPPVLPITDAQLLAPYCDLRLIVVEPCRTQFKMAQHLLENLRAVGQTVDGVILNDRSGLAARYYGGVKDYDSIKVPDGTDKTGFKKARSGASPWRWSYRLAVLAAVGIGGFYWLSTRHDSTVPIVRSAPGAAPAVPPVVSGKAAAPPALPFQPRPAAESPVPVTSSELPMSTAPIAAPARAEIKAPRLDEIAATRKTPAVAIGMPVVRATPVEGLQSALAAIGKAWQGAPLAASGSGGSGIEGRFATMGLHASQLDDDLAVLLQLNTPLLLEINAEPAGQSWVAVTGRHGFKWLVNPPPRQGELLSEAELKQLWTGRGYLPWVDPLHLLELEAGDAGPDRVVRLQQLLVKAGCLHEFESGVFGRETLKAIGRLQAEKGLRVNGRITPEALILLYQADSEFMMPKFTMWR